MARILLLAYLGLLALLYSLQTRLIFVGSETRGTREAQVEPPPGAELVRLKTVQGDQVTALFGPALTSDGRPHSHPETRPTILFFYGNAMCLSASLDLFENFRHLAANVLIPDYVGYGLSGGRPGEQGFYDTADAAYDYLLKRTDVDARRIVPAGWSLGFAVAIDLASRRQVAGAVSFCTFTSMVDMSRRIFPFLPASPLLRHRFDNRTKIGSISCPILLGHGRRDSIIPFAMSDQLANAARGSVTRITLDEADHNDFFLIGGERLFHRIGRFLDELLPVK